MSLRVLEKQKKYVIDFAMMLSIASVLTACSTGNKGTFCDIYTPIYNYENVCSQSISDQIAENNIIHYEQCD